MHGLPTRLNDSIDLWFSWMVSMSWQVAILFVVLMLTGLLLRRRSARFRYALWTLVPVRLLLPPSLALMTGWAWWVLPEQLPERNPSAELSVAPEVSRPELAHIGSDQPASADQQSPAEVRWQLSENGAVIAESEPAVVFTGQDSDDVTAAAGVRSDSRQTLEPSAAAPFTLLHLLFAAWLAGVVLLTGRLVVGYRRVSHWIARSMVADPETAAVVSECCEQLSHRVRVAVRVTTAVRTPLVTGLWNPVILLPPAVLESLSREELKAVLFHELQHVARRDVWQELVMSLLQVVYFFHPCVWLANRQLRRLREQACDESTVAMLNGRRDDYGAGFVKTAALLVKPTPRLTLGIADSDEQTASRLKRILDPRLRTGRGVSWAGLVAVILLGLIVIPSAARRPAVADSSGNLVADAGESTEAAGQDAAGPVDEDSAAAAEVTSQGSEELADDVVSVGDGDVEPFELIGQVLDEAGTASPQSTVQFEWYSRKQRRLLTLRTLTDDDGRFRAAVRMDRNKLYGLMLSAWNSEGSQLGVWRPAADAQATVPMSITVQLAEARLVQVQVQNEEGATVDGASAVLQLRYPHKSQVETTNNAGVAQFIIPAGERIEAVVAWKDGLGLDYRLYSLSRQQKADSLAQVPEFPKEDTELLTLNGASPVTVRVTDEDGQPLPDVLVYPWLLKKEPGNSQLNLSMFYGTFRAPTGADGTVTFGWMPSWQKSRTTFWSDRPGYDHQRAMYTPDIDDGQLEVVLRKLVPVRGHVYRQDGSAASGITITARGHGYSFDAASMSAVTDENGAYELLATPDRIYLIVATGERLAAAPQTGFAVFKGKPLDGKDFTLRSATRVHGQLQDEETGEPVAGERIFVYQYGTPLTEIDGVELPNPENSRTWVQPIFARNTETDDSGRFELFVGDGDFDIRPPRQEKAEKFTVAGESEKEFLVTTLLVKEVELTGTIRDQATGRLLTGVRVSGVSRSSGGRDWVAVTSDAGVFQVKQYPAATYVHAVSSDQRLGAITEVPAKQSAVELGLQTLGSATGRLLEMDTKKPWARQTIQYGVRVPNENDQTWSNRFGGRATTAADGTFELPRLVPGWEYELSMKPRNDGTIPSLGGVTVEPGETKNIGDVTPPPPRKPYVPPTLEDRIAAAFAVSGTPQQRHQKAMELAALINQQLLVVFGAPDSPAVRWLMDIRYNDDDFRPLRDEFRFLAIPTDETNRTDAAALASHLQVAIDSEQDFQLVLLDSAGAKRGVTSVEQFRIDGELNRDRLVKWLQEHMPEPVDARQLLEEALERAKQEDKRVLVQETATWCGPCHRLARFLDANREWEKDYIWVRMDHRYQEAREVMQELRDGADGGIPWFVVLDADGARLATSNEPESGGNIGFPVTESELSHFEQVLKSTRQRLTDDEIAHLMAQLTDKE